jgi:hypothetical protein
MILQPYLIRYSPPLDLAQGGFRAQRSGLDQALCLHDLIQDFHNKHHGANTYPAIGFLDIKAVYDTVDRNVIWTALQRSGTSLPLLGLLQRLFDDVSIISYPQKNSLGKSKWWTNKHKKISADLGQMLHLVSSPCSE